MQGAAFTTYAVQRIRGSMLDELRSRDWAPRSVRRNAREVTQSIHQLEQDLGRPPSEQEVADHLQIELAEYRQILLIQITASCSLMTNGMKFTVKAVNRLKTKITMTILYKCYWKVIFAKES